MEGNDNFEFNEAININSQKPKEANIGEVNSSSQQTEKIIYDSREDYIKLNELGKVKDIKDEIFSFCESKNLCFLKAFFFKDLKLGEYKCTSDFNLEDTMNSVEVNHFKMDPHANYREANTYLKQLRLGKVKKMEDLNLKEVFLFKFFKFFICLENKRSVIKLFLIFFF